MKWIKIFLVNIFIFVLLLLGAEVVLRLLFPAKISRAGYDISGEFLKHSLMITDRAGHAANFESSGFRRHTEECSSEEVHKNILLVGDSNIAAIFVPDRDSPGNVLKRELNKKRLDGVCFNVDSFGVAGFGPDQSVFAIEHILSLAKKYDYVIYTYIC